MRLFAIVMAICSFASQAQYNNGSLVGPWMTDNEGYTYLIFDGKGGVEEFGVFKGVTGTPVGTYSVSPEGAITGAFPIWNLTFTGKLATADSGHLIVDGKSFLLDRIRSPGALGETLTGTLVDAAKSETRHVTFRLDGFGRIASASGLPGVTGKIFSQGGRFGGYIASSDDTRGSCWKNFRVSGTVTGDNLSGSVRLDCTGQEGATVSLVRSGTPIALRPARKADRGNESNVEVISGSGPLFRSGIPGEAGSEYRDAKGRLKQDSPGNVK